jgi:hypothetical protein
MVDGSPSSARNRADGRALALVTLALHLPVANPRLAYRLHGLRAMTPIVLRAQRAAGSVGQFLALVFKTW